MKLFQKITFVFFTLLIPFVCLANSTPPEFPIPNQGVGQPYPNPVIETVAPGGAVNIQIPTSPTNAYPFTNPATFRMAIFASDTPELATLGLTLANSGVWTQKASIGITGTAPSTPGDYTLNIFARNLNDPDKLDPSSIPFVIKLQVGSGNPTVNVPDQTLALGSTESVDLSSDILNATVLTNPAGPKGALLSNHHISIAGNGTTTPWSLKPDTGGITNPTPTNTPDVITLKACNAKGICDSGNFNLTVTANPVITTIPDQSFDVYSKPTVSLNSYIVNAASVTDKTTTLKDHSLTVQNTGTSTNPSWTLESSGPNGVTNLTTTPATVSLVACDVTGKFCSAPSNFKLSVNLIAPYPLAGNPTVIGGLVGHDLSTTPAGNKTFWFGPDVAPIGYTLNTTSPDTFHIAPATTGCDGLDCPGLLSGTPTKAGDYTLQVTATNAKGSISTAQIPFYVSSFTVADQSVLAGTAPNIPLSGIIGMAGVQENGTILASHNLQIVNGGDHNHWSLGVLPHTLVSNPTSQPQTVTLTGQDANYNNISTSFQLSVASEAPAPVFVSGPTNDTVNGFVGEDLSGTPASNINFVFSSAIVPVNNYIVKTNNPGTTLSISPKSCTAPGNCPTAISGVPATAGQFKIAVTAFNPAATTHPVIFNVASFNVDAQTVNENSTVNILLPNVIGMSNVQVTGSTLADHGLSIAGSGVGPWSITGTAKNLTSSGPVSVQLTGKDGNGQPHSISFPLTVAPAPPTTVTLTCPQPPTGVDGNPPKSLQTTGSNGVTYTLNFVNQKGSFNGNSQFAYASVKTGTIFVCGYTTAGGGVANYQVDLSPAYPSFNGNPFCNSSLNSCVLSWNR